MPTIIHFIDVGQGSMVLIQAASGQIFVFDCNITDANATLVLNYVATIVGNRQSIDAFICSHRDADHMRGVDRLHAKFSIRSVWDSDHPGTSTNTAEYASYMRLRRTVGSKVIKRLTREDFGATRFRYLSAKDERLQANANAQGIVLKIEQRDVINDNVLGSAMLPGDSDAQTWRKGIMIDYDKPDVSSSILMAAHHGSLSFFDDPGDDEYYYTAHMKAIAPNMTVISVGQNNHGHPNQIAIDLYERYSKGSNKGNKIRRTDAHGTIKLILKDDGGWALLIDQ
jgi:competence protein ComEC